LLLLIFNLRFGFDLLFLYGICHDFNGDSDSANIIVISTDIMSFPLIDQSLFNVDKHEKAEYDSESIIKYIGSEVPETLIRRFIRIG
jgi:hypothetical protein